MPAVTTSYYGCCSFFTASFKRFSIKSTTNHQTSNNNKTKKNIKRNQRRRRYIDGQEVTEAQAYYTQSMKKQSFQHPQDRDRASTTELHTKETTRPVRRQTSFPPASSKPSNIYRVRRTVSSSSDIEDTKEDTFSSNYALIEQAISKLIQKPSAATTASKKNSPQKQQQHRKYSVVESSRNRGGKMLPISERKETATRAQEAFLKNPHCKHFINERLEELLPKSCVDKCYFNTNLSKERSGSLVQQQQQQQR